MHIMQVLIWSQFFWSLLAGMSFSLWCGLCPSKGFTLHTEVTHICTYPSFSCIYEKEGMYTYALFSHLLFPTLLRACWAVYMIWRFSSKIQQLKESGLINLWIRQEQDLVGQRAEEGLNVTLSQCEIYIKILQTISCFWKVQAVVGYLLSPSITCSLCLWLASSTFKFIWNSIILSNGSVYRLKWKLHLLYRMSQKVADRNLRAMLHSLPDVTYTSLKMTPLKNIFSWSFFNTTKNDQTPPRHVHGKICAWLIKWVVRREIIQLAELFLTTMNYKWYLVVIRSPNMNVIGVKRAMEGSVSFAL